MLRYQPTIKVNFGVTFSHSRSVSIANTFAVTLDYLSGEGTNASFDKKIVKRIQQIEDLDDDDKAHLLAVVDAFLRDASTRKAYGQ